MQLSLAAKQNFDWTSTSSMQIITNKNHKTMQTAIYEHNTPHSLAKRKVTAKYNSRIENWTPFWG